VVAAECYAARCKPICKIRLELMQQMWGRFTCCEYAIETRLDIRYGSAIRRQLMSCCVTSINFAPFILVLQGNQFTGELPVSPEWKHLLLYMAANNRFSGTFPAAFYDVPFLAHLDITNNQ
jgi:hypothetical protein